MSFFALAFTAYTIDLLMGELPCKHPVIFMGDFIHAFERRFYRDSISVGALLVLSLLLTTYLASLSVIYLASLLPAVLSFLLLAVCASTGLAMNMLHRSVSGVLTAENPRLAISYLVSRDTKHMSDSDIHKAAIETWAENLSDGVIAPLFYLTCFGLSGLAVYKAINTLDSMVGYKTPRYYRFGKVAARLDDVANYIPARLTAALIALISANKRRAWRCLFTDGHKLESPNAGYPIAAMAGALGVALGGDTIYHGEVKHKPQLGEAIYPLSAKMLQQGLAMKTRVNNALFIMLIIGILL